MSAEFYPISRLFRDRAFLGSLGASLIAVVVAGTGVADWLIRGKIFIKPIAEVAFVTEPMTPLRAIEPISAISEVANTRTRGDSEPVLSAYLTPLDDLCRRGEHLSADGNFRKVLLMEPNGRVTVATVALNRSTCALLKGLKRGQAIYAASDNPIAELASQKRYVVLEQTMRTEAIGSR
jgi:hypothetical protein